VASKTKDANLSQIYWLRLWSEVDPIIGSFGPPDGGAWIQPAPAVVFANFSKKRFLNPKTFLTKGYLASTYLPCWEQLTKNHANRKTSQTWSRKAEWQFNACSYINRRVGGERNV
jgi:hypothetical protein